MEHIRWLLDRPPFRGIDPAAVRVLEANLEVAYLPRGQQLVSAGERLDAVWVIRSGAVRRHQPGPDVVAEEGELIGAAQALDGLPVDFDHEVIEDLLGYVLPIDAFVELAEDPTFRLGLGIGSGNELGPATGGLTVVAHSVASAAHRIDAAVSVAEAAREMDRLAVDALLVDGMPVDGQPTTGIITTRDLRSRVVAARLSADTPVRAVATAPLRTLPADTPLPDALVFLLEHDIHHVPLIESGIGSSNSEPDTPSTRLLSNDDILAHFGTDAFSLLRRLGADDGDRSAFAQRVTQAVRGMVRADVGPGAIGRSVSTLVDGLMRSLCREAEAKLGQAPAPYAFCACGSQGRREQTLLTDQDNFLVYQGEPSDASWFDQLARYVVDGLVESGIPACEGGYMATNWAGDLGWWHDAIDRRLRNPDPEAAIDLNVLADLRVVAGSLDPSLVLAPLQGAAMQPLLVRRIGAEAVKYRPPGRLSRLFGRDDHFEVKRHGIIPIVGLGRLFGLELGLNNASTSARLAAGAEAGLLSETARLWLTDGLAFLTGVRLRGQLRSLEQTGNPAAVPLERRDLNAVEQNTLRDLLRVIADVQHTTIDRLGLDAVA